MFLILVVGENSLESRQLGYWDGGKISRGGNISWGISPPGGSYLGGDILLHRYSYRFLCNIKRKRELANE